MSRYRIVTQDDGRFLPEVRKLWWWEPITRAGYTVERCDYGGERTIEEARANCAKHAHKERFVPVVYPVADELLKPWPPPPPSVAS